MGFIRLHTLRSWFKLPENDKKQHQIEDCDKCQSIISNAILHTRSASEGTTELYEVCTSFFEKLRIKYPSTSQNSNKRAEQVLSVLEPIIESNFNESIKKAACKKYKLTPKLSSSEKQKEKIKVLRENNRSMTKSWVIRKMTSLISSHHLNRSANITRNEWIHFCTKIDCRDQCSEKLNAESRKSV